MPSILYSDIFGLSLSISKKTTCFVNAFFQRHPQEVSALLVPSIQALMLRWIHRVLRKTSFTWKNIYNYRLAKRKTIQQKRHQNSMSWIQKQTGWWFHVVSTHLKNISQIGSFSQVGVKIKNVWNHHPANVRQWHMRKAIRWRSSCFLSAIQ